MRFMSDPGIWTGLLREEWQARAGSARQFKMQNAKCQLSAWGVTTGALQIEDCGFAILGWEDASRQRGSAAS